MRSIFVLILTGCLLTTQSMATVIGDDDRIAATGDDKEAAGIGVIFSRFSGKNNLFRCTGTLIDQRFILTAAHCIFKQEKGGFAQEVSFIPGVHTNKNSGETSKYLVEKTWVTSQFVNAEKNGNPHSWYTDRSDIALLQITQKEEPSPGELFGIKSLISDFNSLVEGQKYLGSFASYPNDKPMPYTPWKETGCEYWAQDLGTINTSCDTEIGSSGGALLTETNQIIGVVSSFSSNLNFATRITSVAAIEIKAIVDGAEAKEGYFIFNEIIGSFTVINSSNLNGYSK